MVGLIYRRVGVEPGIGHDTVDKIVDYARNAVNPTEALIQTAGWVQDLFRIGYCNLVSRTRAAANHDFAELSANVSRKVMPPISNPISSSRIASSDRVSSMLPSNA